MWKGPRSLGIAIHCAGSVVWSLVSCSCCCLTDAPNWLKRRIISLLIILCVGQFGLGSAWVAHLCASWCCLAHGALGLGLGQLSPWGFTSFDRLFQAYPHGDRRVPSNTREQAPLRKHFSSLRLCRISVSCCPQKPRDQARVTGGRAQLRVYTQGSMAVVGQGVYLRSSRKCKQHRCHQLSWPFSFSWWLRHSAHWPVGLLSMTSL